MLSLWHWFYKGQWFSYHLNVKDLKYQQSSEMTKQSPGNHTPWYNHPAAEMLCWHLLPYQPGKWSRVRVSNAMLQQVINLCNVSPGGMCTLHSQQLQGGVQDHEKRRCNRNLYLDTCQQMKGIKVRSPVQVSLYLAVLVTESDSPPWHLGLRPASLLCTYLVSTQLLWYWLLSPVLLCSPYLGTVGLCPCGCRPSSACLASPLTWAPFAWQGSWLLLLPGTQDEGERGRKDGDRDWDRTGRLLQKTNSFSSQWNATYPK